MTKGLTIPKFGVLSFSSSTSTVYAVQVQLYRRLLLYERVLQYCCCCEGGDCCEGGVGVSIREQRSSSRSRRGGGVANREQRLSSRSRRGGVSENQIAGAAAARLFFLTAVAIAIATRPFKFHEISVSNTSSSFVSSIHSFGLN